MRDAFDADHGSAWQHYLRYGAAESLTPEMGTRAPTPWFDIEFYLQANPDVAAAADAPSFAFRHFTEYGMNEFRAPNALGQQKPLTEENLLAYAKANPDLLLAYEVPASATSLTAQQRHDLALHFHRWGHAEGCAAEPTQLVAPSPGDRIGADDDIWFELVGTIGGTTHEWVAFSPLS